MADSLDPSQVRGVCLGDAVDLNPTKLQNPEALSLYGGMTGDGPILVVLAAGKGTRFGTEPKCIQPVRGTPLARHSIDAFRRFWPGPAICLVGYRHAEVSAALGADNAYVLSAAPAGGTALAAFEAFSIPQLAERNPALIITMGDRIVPSSTYRRLWDTSATRSWSSVANGACRFRRPRVGWAATCGGPSLWWATPSPRCARYVPETWAPGYRSTWGVLVSPGSVWSRREAFHKAAFPVPRR